MSCRISSCLILIFFVVTVTSSQNFASSSLNMKTHIISKLLEGKKHLRLDEANVGYEPYWRPPIEEIMKRLNITTTRKKPKTFTSITTEFPETTTDIEASTRNIYLCHAAICLDMYIEYGFVCGRSWSSGQKTYVYTTFKDMCELERQNCKLKEWTLAYRGKCTKDLPVWSSFSLPILQRKNKAVKYAYNKDGDQPPNDYLDYAHYDYGKGK